MIAVRRPWASPMSFAGLLALGLFAANLVEIPRFVYPSNLPGTVNLALPALLAAMASVPSILSGRGGVDLSVGPLLGFVNVFLIGILLPHALGSAWAAVPLALLLGASVGAANGLLVTLLRLQPIVVTLGAYLVLTGLALVVMPQAVGSAPRWAMTLANGWHGVPRSLALFVVALLVWLVARRSGYVRALQAVGSDDRAAFTAGVNVDAVRVGAYALGGLFAGFAGLAVTVLISSGDPTLGPQYTLVSFAAVALGGNALAGGAGTVVGPLLGALVIFLLQNLLAAVNVSSLWIQVAYGAILLGAIVLNAQVRGGIARWRAS